MIPNPVTYHTVQARLDSQDRPDLTGVKMAAAVTIRWPVWLPGPRPLWR